MKRKTMTAALLAAALAMTACGAQTGASPTDTLPSPILVEDGEKVTKEEAIASTQKQEETEQTQKADVTEQEETDPAAEAPEVPALSGMELYVNLYQTFIDEGIYDGLDDTQDFAFTDLDGDAVPELILESPVQYTIYEIDGDTVKEKAVFAGAESLTAWTGSSVVCLNAAASGEEGSDELEGGEYYLLKSSEPVLLEEYEPPVGLQMVRLTQDLEDSFNLSRNAISEAAENLPLKKIYTFVNGKPKDFSASNNWTNGDMFNVFWRNANVTFEDRKMQLIIDKDPKPQQNIPYSGGEFRSYDFYGYGKYEVCMKPIRNDGVVSSFFTYTGPTDGNPWDEIDIEFLGKDTKKVQFNYFTNSAGNHEKLYALDYDASEEFHVYGFEWLEDSITWYVDGEPVHTADVMIPSTPGKIMMNAWCGTGVDEWLKKFKDKNLPLTAEYQWFSFEAAEDGDDE